MTSSTVQNRARLQPTQSVWKSIKILTAPVQESRSLATVVSEAAGSSFIVDIEYPIRTKSSLSWRKEMGDETTTVQTSAWEAVGDSDKIVRLEDPDPLPAGFDESLTFPFTKQPADRVQGGPGHFGQILTGKG